MGNIRPDKEKKQNKKEQMNFFRIQLTHEL